MIVQEINEENYQKINEEGLDTVNEKIRQLKLQEINAANKKDGIFQFVPPIIHLSSTFNGPEYRELVNCVSNKKLFLILFT